MAQWIAPELPLWQRIYQVFYEMWYGTRSYRPAYLSVDVSENVKPLEATKALEATMHVGYPQHSLSDAMTRSANIAPTLNLADISGHQTSKFWIYNVSMLDFEANTSLGLVKFPGKGKRRYAVVTSLPKCVVHIKDNVDSNEIHGVYTNGARVAMDMINPGNLGLDQDEKSGEGINYSGNNSVGRDLGAKGVFWSIHNPPLEKELASARKRMKTRYKSLLQEAGVISRVTPKTEFERRIKKLMEDYKFSRAEAILRVYHQTLQITPEHHAAMDYYRLTSEWHPIKGFTTPI
jgi:hypothetical protein